jgi:NAD(P)-dependent dehydrogenase (short-subunit alcohol dehydrogenase family)
MKIKDAVVLVTGSNRGLGLALARASLAAGARRVYAGARDPSSLANLLREGGDRVTPLSLDIGDERSLANAARQAPDVTLLLNNAGVLASYGLLNSTPQQIAQDFAVNCFALLATCKAFLPALERAAVSGGGALVNVLSVVSLASMPGLGGYSASKAAAYSLTQALRGDLAKKQIRVHAALPGAIDTDMVRAMDMAKASPESVAQGILAGVEQDQEDIFPDPMSRELFAIWRADPKQLERQLAQMSG